MSADVGDTPRRIGRFEIRREIGRGTMGVVYEAEDPVLGRTVALKTIALAVAGAPRDRAAFEQRFLAEARIAARLSHPGIVVIHDVGRDTASGTLYMALEHLSGRTLEELLAERRPMEWREALRVLWRVAAALHHAHAQGVVHRDVKPANIMLLDSGEPKIMDFGIAKLVAEGGATSTGHLLGTPLYMAPEQARGEAVDARTDIFSLGAIAYSLLTGRRAFEARSIPSILARVLHHDPPPPSAVVAGLPSAIDDLVARAMAKAPADRYPTAKAMAEDIEDVLGGRTPRHRAGWTPPPVGARTLVSAGGKGEELEELLLVEGPPGASLPPPPRSRPGARPRLLAMILLGGGIGIGAAGLLRFEMLPPEEGSGPLAPPVTWAGIQPAPPSPEAGEPSPSATPAEAAELASPASLEQTPASPAPQSAATEAPASAPEAPSPEGAGLDASAGAPVSPPSPPAPSPAEPAPEGAPAPDGAGPPRPASSPSPSSRPKEAEKRAADPKEKARLVVHLDPALQPRSLRLWLDGKLVADEKLDAGAARKARADLALKAIPVSPGRRQVRVQVRTEEGLRAERLVMSFKPGATRRLDVKAGRSSGALSFVLR